MAESERCTRSRRADHGHSWAFDGDDPYIVCQYCKQRRDALSGSVISEGLGAPRRIQMSRQHPWRVEHPDAVIVARPSKWGNPFRPVRCDRRHESFAAPHWHVRDDDHVFAELGWLTRSEASAWTVKMFTIRAANPHVYPPLEVRTALAGKDLACWCPLDQPCHADVLLAICSVGVAG